MLRNANYRLPPAVTLRRFLMASAIAGLALLTALWSVAPPAAASSHPCTTSGDSDAQKRDCRTLLNLKGELDPNDRLWSWYEGNPMVNWEGLFSTPELGVTSIEIYETMRGDHNPLTLGGTVPAGLGSLPNLRFLKMWRLGLTGSIPAELGNLSNLEELRLDQNKLTGSIPTGLGSLSNLRYLGLAINQLSGGIPSDFGSLSSLEYLSLDRNFLGLQTHPTAGSSTPDSVENPIPDSLGNLSALEGLDLGDNNFSGSIPAALGNLRELETLGLSGNNFDGNIPSALGNLTKLESLSLWGNQLSGSIPSQLGNLAALEFLDLAYNGLQNSIPAQLGRLSKLRHLSLNENQLSGSIPSQLGDLTQLTQLFLDTNRLNGPIPADLGDLTLLRDLGLARNELSGAIPAELGDMTSLESLNLNDNALSMNIPAELGDLQNVDYISLSCNFLTGNIPSELGDLPNLRILLLDNNKLNIEAADVPASLDNIGFARLTSGNVCPRGQPDADPPSTDEVPPTFEMAELSRDGLTIVLTYNESLDSSNVPATTDFTVKVDGQAVTVSTVEVRIREVRLDLGGAVTEHQGVTVAYEDPTSGDDEKAIQDRSGNDAADLTERTVTNESTVDDEVAPTFESVAMSSDGNTITLTYDEILDTQAGPGTTNFVVTVEGERRDVSRVSVNDRSAELRLVSPATVNQTVSVSYFDPTTGDDDNAIQDRAGNDAATLENEPVPNDSQAQDNRAPRFERAAMSSDGLSITLVYDEALDDAAGPAASDFAVEVDEESVDLSTSSAVTVSGRTVVLRLASAVRALQGVTVTYTDPTSGDDTNAIQDAAGNDAVDLTDHKVTNASTVLDQQAPLFQSVAMSTDGATITLTYDEILDGGNGPATANFQIMVQGERRDVSTLTVSGKTVELVLANAITTGQSVTVTYHDPTNGIDDLNAIQDRSGNDANSLINEPVTNASTVTDSTAPTFVRAVMSSNGLSITLTYDEALDDANGPGTTDFTVTVDEVSAEPSQVTLSGRTVVLGLGTGVESLQDVTVSYTDPTGDDDASAIQDAAGNDAVSLVDQEVANASTVLDEVAPVFQSATTSGDGAKIILTYDEILDSANKPATANFEITVQGEARDASTVTVVGKTVELGLGTAITAAQAVTVAYTDPTAGVDDTNAIQDRAGNDAADLTEREVTNASGTADGTAPQFVRVVLASDGWTITLTYDEVLDDVNEPATTDFAVTVGGDSETISSLDVRDRRVLLFLAGRVPSLKAVKLTYTDPSASNDANAIQDPAGNDADSLVDQDITNASTVLDERAPEFEDATTSTDGTKVILSYDEVLDSENEPAAGNFEIKVQGESRDVSTVSVSGKTVELDLGSAITTGQVVTVSYTDPTYGVDDTNAIQDRAGNDAVDLFQRDVTNPSTVADTRAPRFVRAAMSSDGSTLTLTYDEVLDDTNRPSTSDFAVTVAGQSADVSSVDVSGRAVLVELVSAVTAGQDVKVTYTDPSTDNDTNAIQDPAGNDAATLTNQPVANTSSVPDERAPEFQRAEVSSDGLTLTLTYDEALDGDNGPRPADFVVSVEGERRPVSTVTVSGTDVALRMASVITSDLTVAVTYTDPTVGVNDTKAIQDAAGNDAASLLSWLVTNGSAVEDSTPPGFVRAVVSSDGGTITLTFDEVLDADQGPGISDFLVKVDGESVTLSVTSTGDVRGRTVVVGLDTAVRTDQDVTVTYTDPTSGNDQSAIQDPVGNDAATLTDQMVTNASTIPDDRAPKFVSATTSVDGLSVILTFDEDLDSQNEPRTANFWITVQGERRDVSTVDVSGKTVTLGLGTAITDGQAVAVSYTDPTAGVDDRNAIQDEAGNDAASLSNTVINASTIADTTAPRFVRAVLSSDGGTIVLTYDEVLDAVRTPLANDFAVTVDEQTAALSSSTPVSVHGRTVALGLGSAVTADQDVKVSYTDPTDGVDDTYAIQDPAGNDAASLTDQAVTNASAVPDERAPVFRSAATSTDGLMVVLTFDEDLDSGNGPRTSDFAVTVQGERRSASTVTVSGKTVTLGLSKAIAGNETVAVIYTDPTAGVDDRNAIQDSVGNDAASLTEPVINNSSVVDAQAPSLDSAETSTDGGRLILTFDEVLDSDNIPPADEFEVTVDDAVVNLASTSSVTVRGRTVVLGLETAVTADQDIKVTYTDPTAGDDVNAIQDPAGNDVATITDRTVTNRVGQEPSRPSTPGGSGSSGSTPGSSTPGTTPGTPQGPLVLTITVSGAPIEVGQTLNYTVTIVNTGTEPLTGVTWRDVTAGTSSQSLNDIAVGGSTSTTGSFGTVQAGHMPGVILTVASDSDQTSERSASLFVQVVAATPQPQGSGELSGQPPGSGTRPRVPSSLVLRVVRVQFNVPDVHLAHNIPDLLLTLPDGSETTCNFLTHYENTGGLTRWGHTTSEVLEERPGSLTQYYQRGVVDCHEREGDWLMERRLTWDHFGGGIDGSEDLGVEPHLLSEQPGELLGPWGHRVSNYAVDGTYIGFLDFFTALGGVPAFGYPKSEARYDNDPRRQLGIAVSTKGFVRQYFQAAVMEYHPDTLSFVMLRLLGDDLRNRRYPNESYETFSSFGSVPPLRFGQIYVAELVSASPGAAPTLGPPVAVTPLPATPAKPSTLKLRVDRVLYHEPDVHMGHNIPDLTLLLPDGSESTCNFLAYYESNHGVARWGHATSEVLEERDGVLTQYFQRGVLDCEERDGAWGVSRRLAWDYVGGGAAGAPDLGVEPALVSEQAGDLVGPWGHRVSNYAVDGTFIGFLDFFSALGGVETFGYPKTEARYDDDPRAELSVLGAARRVIRQYFQSAVLEYHPADTAQPVKLRLLGDDVRDRLYPNQTYRAYNSFGPSIPLAKGQFYSPERITPPGTGGAPVRTPPPPPSATSPSVIPSAPSTLGLRVNRVLFSAPDVHLAHNIPDLTLTLADGSEASCEFLTYFESTYGLARWGHPISEVLEERTGSLTQYFQRGVLDCHERDGEWRVERRLAWDHIGGGVDGAPDLGVEPDLLSDQAGELLGPWGHQVSNYAVDGTYVGFLDFFTSLGGEATFGLPKTEARYDDDPRAALRVPGGAAGVIRQYFQAAVLEYHPNDAAQPVKLYLLGDTLRDWRYPTYGVFITFGSFGPLTEGQPYYPVATSSVLRPAG